MGNSSSSSHGESKNNRKCRSLPNSPDVKRQKSTPYSKTNGTAIPLPATVLVQRRCPPDKVRPLPPTPNHVPSIPGLAKTSSSGSGSLNNSPINSHPHVSLQSSPQKVSNGLRQPQCKIPSSPFTSPKMGGHSSTTSTTTSPHTTTSSSNMLPSDKPPPLPAANPPPPKHSMLDKFKLFKSEKSSSSSNSSTKSERTSSSSGFSSARSERSDSSSSLNHIPPSITKMKTTSKISTANNEINRNKESSVKKHSKQSSNPEKNSSKQTKDKSPAKSSIKDEKGIIKSQKNSSKNSNSEQEKLKSALKSSSSEQNTKSSDSKLNSGMVRSNSSNLSNNNNNNNNTGIPKPMAAIKGQTKNMHINSDDKSNLMAKDSQKDISKNSCDNGVVNSQQHNSEQSKTHIVRPLPTHPHQHNGLNINNGLVPCIKPAPILNGILKNCDNDINSSNSINNNLINNRNMKTIGVDFQSISEENNINESLTINKSPAKSLNGTNPNTDSYEEEQTINITPMKPLLEGYNSHVTILPTRTNQKVQYLITEYSNGDIDIGQGYMSDGGETFRKVPVLSSRFLEIDNGYLSDGSIGALGNHLQQQQQQQQQQQSQPLTPHRGKHFLNGLRGRQLLPTTIIEEKARGSHGSLDSIGTGTQSLSSPTNAIPNLIIDNNNSNSPPSVINSPKGNINGNQINSDSDSTNMESKCDSNPSSRSSSRIGFINGRDNNSPKIMSNGNNDSLNKLTSTESNPNQKIKSSSQKQSSSPSKTKGVPQSFGYIKRTNGSALGVVTTTTTTQSITNEQQKMIQQQQQHQQDVNRTAHVSGVPRNNKIKVSGGTQTQQAEIQTKIPPTNQHRSFSLTGPGATQLSQAIRERLANGSYSLPKPGTEMHMFQHRVKYRHSGKILDGSLSDTQTYAEVKPEQSTYAMWLKHSNTTSSRLSAGDSIESLQHVLGSPAMQRHSAHKLIHRNSPSNQIINNGPIVEGAYMQSPRLNRSNSIRSSKSDKMYSTLSSNQSGDVDAEPFYCLPVGSIQTQIQNGIAAGGNLAKISPWSQPTSPTPPAGRSGLLSPTHSGISSSGYNSITPSHRLTYPKRNDDIHGSTASLLSGGSSLYGSVEERQANEVRRLKRELIEAREQVMSLSNQLSTNAHVVSAFEQSLSNMKQRLQQLTETTERKDSELTDMRQTIELLRKQSIQAGLTSAHIQSMGLQSQISTDQITNSPRKQSAPDNLEYHNKQTANGGTNISSMPRDSITSNLLEIQQNNTTRGSICSLNSITSVNSTTQDKKKKKSWLKSSFTKAFSKNAKISKTEKHISSIPNTPQKQQQHRVSDSNSVAKQMLSGGNNCGDDYNTFNSPNHVIGASNTPSNSTKSSPQKCVTIIENAKPLDAIDLDGNPVVEDLKKQLREKDLILTDIRLEALSSASQLESLRDTVMKMRAEMLTLKQNNERLQKLVTSRSLAGSEISLRNSISPNGSIISDSKRYSLVDSSRPHIDLPKSLEEEVEEDNIPPAPAPEPPPPSTLPIQKTSPTTHIDLTPPPPAIEAPSPTRSQPPILPSVSEDGPDVTDGKKIEIAVYLGQPESFSKYLEEIIDSSNPEAIYSNSDFHKDKKESEEIYSNAATEIDERMYSNPNFHEFVIACTYISGKTTWQNLDYIVRKTFKDYLARIDPGTNLGLNTDSITSYHLGEAKRGPEIGFPQLLPCGYIIGNVKTLYICLQGVGSLAFDSLIPRSIVHRYITLLTEHRRLILCGPSGTGKSYLARKLAEFIVARGGRNNISEAIATFNVDNKSSKELRQFLSYIGEQASMPNGESELPSVIILDNLHHASALGDVFSSLLSSGPAAKLPCIIGTMSQATCNTTNLQLHHNFRWVLTANHMEPVKGFLGRYLRRRLYTLELHSQNHQPELTAVFAWLPTVWQHINRFLEIHSSSDVTIGPRLFLSCPLNLKDSQVWFTDIWNYHIVPYLIEAVREGVQLYGRRGGAWNDPSTFIRDTYPWKYGPDSVPALRQINADDVGLEGCEIGKSDSHDPLLNMLIHLQEAANYSENQEPESDCVSLDSNLTQDSSAGVENEVE
ncbi:protein sickie-like isoform X2 [Condylostylus longicornis]|uniref:protein sickie-like isoform X2 n=1 Tax=Condylostylus longicornis TaxID=2530218 RepID=UPI00244DCA90|nr:protein sickie-like isoform X2 [Condylostylus longicornis]